MSVNKIAEEALHHVKPGGAGGRKVCMKARVFDAHWPITLPSSVLIAANNVVIPSRLQSWAMPWASYFPGRGAIPKHWSISSSLCRHRSKRCDWPTKSCSSVSMPWKLGWPRTATTAASRPIRRLRQARPKEPAQKSGRSSGGQSGHQETP